MNCKDFALLISDYKGQHLDLEENKTLQLHLNSCEDCNEEVKNSSELQSILTSSIEIMPEGYEDNFLTRLNNQIYSVEPGESFKKKGVWNNIQQLFKQNRQLSIAFAVMTIALILPLTVIPLNQNKSILSSQPRIKQHTESGRLPSEREDLAQAPITTGEIKESESKKRKKGLMPEIENMPANAPDPTLGSLKNERIDFLAKDEDFKAGHNRKLTSSPTTILRQEESSRFYDEFDKLEGRSQFNKESEVLTDKLALNHASSEEDGQVRSRLALTDDASKTNKGKKQPTRKYNQEQYLLKKGTVRLEVKNLSDTFNQIQQFVKAQEGYVIDSHLKHQEKASSTAFLLLKVPKAKFQATVLQIDSLGIIRFKQIKSEDLAPEIIPQEHTIEELQGYIKDSKNWREKKALQHELKAARKYLTQLKQDLGMATYEVNLFTPYQASVWKNEALGKRLQKKLARALNDSLTFLVDIIAFLPIGFMISLLIFILWLTTKFILVTKLELLKQKSLAMIFVVGLIFFPTYFMGGELFSSTILFVSLIAFIWSLKTIAIWYNQRHLSAKETNLQANQSPDEDAKLSHDFDK